MQESIDVCIDGYTQICIEVQKNQTYILFLIIGYWKFSFNVTFTLLIYALIITSHVYQSNLIAILTLIISICHYAIALLKQ